MMQCFCRVLNPSQLLWLGSNSSVWVFIIGLELSLSCTFPALFVGFVSPASFAESFASRFRGLAFRAVVVKESGENVKALIFTDS